MSFRNKQTKQIEMATLINEKNVLIECKHLRSDDSTGDRGSVYVSNEITLPGIFILNST